MPCGSSAGSSSLPSSISSSEHKSDSSSANSHVLLPQPSSAAPPRTTDQVIELSVSSEELANWRRREQQAQTEPMPWPGRTRSVLRRYSPLVPPTALLIALVVLLVQDLANAHSNADSSDLPNGPAPPALLWSPCSLDNAVANAYNLSAQCATVTLPLCYEGVCKAEDENTTIAVSFKRIPAFGTNDMGASLQTVWYLPDRPDFQTPEEVELQMTLLYEELRGDMDIYTLDFRGSGDSSALSCNASDGSPLQTAIFARHGKALDPSDVQACVYRLNELGYTNLRAFSLASAAQDIERVINQFQSDSQAIVYALGYGTLVAQQLMQQGVSQIIGYVFDGALGNAKYLIPGIETVSHHVSKSDEDFGEVAIDFLIWCQGDADCSKRFSEASSSTTLNQTLAEVYTRLDADTASACSMILTDVNTSKNSKFATATTTPPSYTLRQLLGVMMKDSTLWPFIPVIAYRFHRCGSEDLTLLSQFVNSTFVTDTDTDNPELLFVVQAFSELWEVPSPDHTELLERFTDTSISSGRVYTQLDAYCLFTGDTSEACGNTTVSGSNSSPVESTLSYTANTTVTAFPSGTSLLLLSGGLDALSAPKYSTALFHEFQTDNKALLVASKSTHGVVQSGLLSNGTACARKVLASYVRSRGNLTLLDISCISALPTPSLAISNISSLLVLGVEDAYDGVLLTTNSSSRGGIDGLTDSGSSDSGASSGSTLDELNHQVSALDSSRHRYKVALIVVTCVLGAVSLVGVVAVIYRRHRKHQLAGEQEMLRRMRGDEENELELVHSIYLLSSSSPRSGEHAPTPQVA
ncbi:uncharacterized protein PITG_13424 [Phytophthora infestans T30-4]|uniref:Serine protease family S33 n=2 Tax=Phytophthora infestans TaxID=4787 RepID=D0NLY7_PHYIT|nr:uncharacterized protein PITG_13424 [Phytophthora infestans T30-4]EEY60684.1 conserved hypothetical protein [Phytophthora infestans T30-4]KAF4044545.1 hypothetical protein GN244_ATG03090 [Phytophthora infestans]|eukprot:XP_002900057.1 conserved hypothetical protein [Phytophthora infestans T30-4]